MFGLAALAARRKVDELALTRGYTMLGEALGIDWAQQQVARFTPSDQWERLLTAGLARDFEQFRIEFLSRGRTKEPDVAVENWVAAQKPRIEQFRQLIARARHRRVGQRADARADRQPGAHPARALGVHSRANSHCRIAEARLGATAASSRSASMRAISALSGSRISAARASSAAQNIGSSAIDVSCPAIVTERFSGAA